MEDGINLDRASVCPPEEHPPVADPETKRRSRLYALDVADPRSGVLIDAGKMSVRASWAVSRTLAKALVPRRLHGFLKSTQR